MTKIVGKSLERLETCDDRLQRILHEASEIMNMSVLCGTRSKREQDEAHAAGKTKLLWPRSKHNATPSQAVDVIPYFLSGKQRYDWEDLLAFSRLAGVILAVAHRHGVKLRWGGDWDRDGRSADETFLDLPHFELD